jgi:5-methylthioribose kinase
VADGERCYVIKQARPQLRVAQPWFCSVERNWRELAVLKACAAILGRTPVSTTNDVADGDGDVRRGTSRSLAVATPSVLWEDRENYAFAMTAAPADHAVWRARLLGRPDKAGFEADNARIAAACGRLLGRIHAASWNNARLRDELGDTSLFDALRVDPYYRRIAEVHGDLRPQIERLVASLSQHACALVHADFSPKNLLVSAGKPVGERIRLLQDGADMQLLMVDFETGHFGDPAFDLGFFLSHLSLKAIYHAPRHELLLRIADRFWESYLETLSGRTKWGGGSADHDAIDAGEAAALADRGMRHLGGCVLARIDGKSPVDYLTDTARREMARSFGRLLLGDRMSTQDAMPTRVADNWPAARECLRRLLDDGIA